MNTFKDICVFLFWASVGFAIGIPFMILVIKYAVWLLRMWL